MESSSFSQNILDSNLSFKDLEQLVPAAFTTKASPSTSKKYKFVSTLNAINALQTLGFKPVDARQKNLRHGNIAFQKHYITFIHPDHVVKNNKGQIEEVIQIHIINSHNGSSRHRLEVSLYRLVCDNGMLGLGKNFVSMDLRHMGFDQLELEGKITHVLESIPQMEKLIHKMKLIKMSEEIRKQLALEMATARFGIDNTKKIDLDKLLVPLREQDKKTDLWTTFNLVQEKLIKGGEYNNETGRKIRAYKNFELQMDLNEKIFEVAEKFVTI